MVGILRIAAHAMVCRGPRLGAALAGMTIVVGAEHFVPSFPGGRQAGTTQAPLGRQYMLLTYIVS